MSSAESHLDCIVRSASELCYLGHRRKVYTLCLLYKIYHRVEHPMNEYLNHLVADYNTRSSAALGELAFVIPRCRTDQFRRSFLSTAVCLCNTPKQAVGPD